MHDVRVNPLSGRQLLARIEYSPGCIQYRSPGISCSSRIMEVKQVQVAAMAPCYCESLQTQQHASQLHRLLSWLQTCSRSACCLQSALPASHGPLHREAQYTSPLSVITAERRSLFFSPLVSAASGYIQHVPTLTCLVHLHVPLQCCLLQWLNSVSSHATAGCRSSRSLSHH